MRSLALGRFEGHSLDDVPCPSDILAIRDEQEYRLLARTWLFTDELLD